MPAGFVIQPPEVKFSLSSLAAGDTCIAGAGIWGWSLGITDQVIEWKRGGCCHGVGSLFLHLV